MTANQARLAPRVLST